MLPIFLLDNDWVIFFIPIGIWTAFLFKYFFPKWLQKVDWVKPRFEKVHGQYSIRTHFCPRCPPLREGKHSFLSGFHGNVSLGCAPL